MKTEKVLLFQFEDKKQLEAVKMALFLLQIPARIVREEEHGKPIKLLLEESAPQAAESGVQKLSAPMLVLVNLQEEKLNQLLAMLRANSDCGQIPYKAILTPVNQEWNAIQLLAELKKEHTAMQRKN